jgi:hypothetical protein
MGDHIPFNLQHVHFPSDDGFCKKDLRSLCGCRVPFLCVRCRVPFHCFHCGLQGSVSFHVAGFLIPTCFVIGVGYLDCNTAGLAILFLVLQEGFNAAQQTGYLVSRVDIAPP